MTEQPHKSMSVVLLSAANVGHTIQWANLLTQAGCMVHVVSLHPHDKKLLELDPTVELHILPFGAPWGYVLAAFSLRKLLKSINPDVLNAHFATGYGTLARLAKPKGLKYMLSVWGTDVYEFPASNRIKRWLLKVNLKAADVIGSTSHAMAVQTKKTYHHPKVMVTPFGIDHELFKPPLGHKQSGDIVVGTVKTLQYRYGIDRLIDVFAAVRAELPPEIGARLKLRIVGEGPLRDELHAQANLRGIADITDFVGKVPHNEVVIELHKLDIYVALSRYESFGVAILEANSSGVCTLVSNADGPAEVTIHGETGLIASDDAQATGLLKDLILSEETRLRLAKQGRQHVLHFYSVDKCVKTMIEALNATYNAR